MPISFSKATVGIATLALVTACSSSTTPTPPPAPTTTLNFNTNTTPPVRARNITQTGLGATNAITQAQYDQPTDTVTLTRTGSTPVTLVGADANHPSNGNLNAYQETGATSGTALVAHTAGGDGYAVAFYDSSTATATDPQGSVLHGGTQSTAGTQAAISGATFNGEYLGYASQSIGGGGTASGSITGDVTMTLNPAGNGILAGTLISNRQTSTVTVNNVTNAATPVNGNLEFQNMALATTGFFATPVSGQADGAFFEASPTNPDGEVVGSVLMRGGNGACNLSGNIAPAGRNCVLETGVFVAR